MRSVPRGILLAACLIGPGLAADRLRAAEPAPAKPAGLVPVPDYASGMGERRYLSGDWGGARRDLADRGLTLDLSFTQVVQGVVDGGQDRGTRYGGKLDSSFTLDLDRAGLVPGGMVTMRVESRYGESVNRMAGTLLPVNDVLFFPLTHPIDEDIPAYITELRYAQFFSKQLGVFFGKYATLGGDANEFAGGRGDTQFLGHAFNSASVTATFNPYSTIGGGILFMPSPTLTFAASINASEDSSSTSGFDTLDDGLIWTLAANWQYRLGSLPGGMRATYQYAWDRDFVDLDGAFLTPGGVAIPREGDSWCAYWNLWQYLHVEQEAKKPINVADGRADLQGFGLFLRAAVADRDTNPVEWVVSGGIGGRGVIPSRDNDTFGIGIGYASVRDVPVLSRWLIDDSAVRFEAWYSIALLPSTELTFDVQYADPMLARWDPAWVLGVRLRIAL